MIEEVPLRKEQHNDPFTGNAPLSALHRFVERCGYPFRPERCPENIRTEYPRRTSWLIGCRVFRSESPPLRCLVPTGDEHILRKFNAAGSPFTASAAVAMRLPKVSKI